MGVNGCVVHWLGAGQLGVPGIPADTNGWWNVLSVGAKGAGLQLHEHGAAWLALGSGRKQWAVFPPGRLDETPDVYHGRSVPQQCPHSASVTQCHGYQCHSDTTPRAEGIPLVACVCPTLEIN